MSIAETDKVKFGITAWICRKHWKEFYALLLEFNKRHREDCHFNVAVFHHETKTKEIMELIKKADPLVGAIFIGSVEDADGFFREN